MTFKSDPEKLYEFALTAHRTLRYRQAIDAYESARRGNNTIIGQLAAFQLGVICTEIRLPESECLTYCAAVAQNSANLNESLSDGDLVNPLSLEERVSRYMCQAIWSGPALPSPGHWDPVARAIQLNPGWITQWLEWLISGAPERNEATILMAKWAVAVHMQLMMHSIGPEMLDPVAGRTTGYGSYGYRWAKAWEEGLSQLAVERSFSEMIAEIGLKEVSEDLSSWNPMPIILYPHERSYVEVVLRFTAERCALNEEEMLQKLVREFPDTRLPVLVTLLGGKPAEQGSQAFDQAVGDAIADSFASMGRNLVQSKDLSSLAYEIGYKPFREVDRPEPMLDEVVAAQQALAVALPLATTPDELGVVLGQGSSLETLRTLIEPTKSRQLKLNRAVHIAERVGLWRHRQNARKDAPT